MNENMIQIIAALGSLAAIGAFIFLFRKDKKKQEQIDKLNEIASIFTKHNNFKEEREKIRLKPDLQKTLSSIIGSEGKLEIQIINKGETALIDDIKYITEDINFINNEKNFPFKLRKSNYYKIFGKTKGKKYIKNCEYEIIICFTDSIKNRYISKLQGKGEKVIIVETKEIKNNIKE